MLEIDSLYLIASDSIEALADKEFKPVKYCARYGLMNSTLGSLTPLAGDGPKGDSALKIQNGLLDFCDSNT